MAEETGAPPGRADAPEAMSRPGHVAGRQGAHAAIGVLGACVLLLTAACWAAGHKADWAAAACGIGWLALTMGFAARLSR